MLAWSRNFRDHIVSDPPQFGLSIAQAAQYSALHDAFAVRYAQAIDPKTNSKVNVQAKNSAKAALKANARMLARLVNATPGITNGQRAMLGLRVPDEHVTPVDVPSAWPRVHVVSMTGRTVRLRLSDDASPTRRGKPPGVVGAVVLYYVAEHGENDPSPLMSKWSFGGFSTRPMFQMTIPPDAPALARVWIAACWVNTRGRNGPFSAATSTRIGDGTAGFAGTLRLAA